MPIKQRVLGGTKQEKKKALRFSLVDIAAEMEISKGQASKLAARAIKERWLTKEGREYALVV